MALDLTSVASRALALGAALAALACGGFAARPWDDTAWSPSPTTPDGAFFGVTLPPSATGFLVRETGFQDPVSEVVFELPPSDLDAFLDANGLRRGEPAEDPGFDAAMAGHPPVATELEGFRHEVGEGGEVSLYRACQLWEWPGRTFVHCSAGGT